MTPIASPQAATVASSSARVAMAYPARGFVRAGVDEHDLPALGREQDRSRCPDPAGRSGDDRDGSLHPGHRVTEARPRSRASRAARRRLRPGQVHRSGRRPSGRPAEEGEHAVACPGATRPAPARRAAAAGTGRSALVPRRHWRRDLRRAAGARRRGCRRAAGPAPERRELDGGVARRARDRAARAGGGPCAPRPRPRTEARRPGAHADRGRGDARPAALGGPASSGSGR